jgi:exodeoxyribonuclease VII small subunit
MNDKRYFDNIGRIQAIISRLDSEKLAPEEARELYKTGRELIEECEAILNGYAGTIEEIGINASGA